MPYTLTTKMRRLEKEKIDPTYIEFESKIHTQRPKVKFYKYGVFKNIWFYSK
jgi:hypothetical protein